MIVSLRRKLQIHWIQQKFCHWLQSIYDLGYSSNWILITWLLTSVYWSLGVLNHHMAGNKHPYSLICHHSLFPRAKVVGYWKGGTAIQVIKSSWTQTTFADLDYRFICCKVCYCSPNGQHYYFFFLDTFRWFWFVLGLFNYLTNTVSKSVVIVHVFYCIMVNYSTLNCSALNLNWNLNRHPKESWRPSKIKIQSGTQIEHLLLKM